MFRFAGIDAVSVVVGGPWSVVYEHHVGKLRSNDSSDTRTVNGDSIYRIGSITKAKSSFVLSYQQVIVVLEILLLQEKGKLSLDDSPLKYIPELNISQDITLEMLATQMSGLGRDRAANPLPDLSKFVGGTCGRRGYSCTSEEFIHIIGHDQLVFQPQTQPSCTFITFCH
jgi:CubicO group peptidase (beta-lactamase class C family)